MVDWEEGKEFPSIQQMRKASEVYRRPLAAFYLPEPPKDFRVPNDFRRLPESQRDRFPPEFLIEVRRMQYQREAAVALAIDDEYPIRNMLGSVKSSERVADVAARVRQFLGVTLEQQTAWPDDYAALNGWKTAIERLGVLVFHFEKVQVRVARGVSVADYPFPFIGVNGKDRPRGRIFSLLHEFRHLLLNTGGVCDTLGRPAARGASRDELETFCNRVAGAALVPGGALLAHPVVRRHGVGSDWSSTELSVLADHYRVSVEVVLRRLLSVGRTSRSFYVERRKELTGVELEKTGGPLPMGRRVLRRIGQPFARIVIEAYYDDRITGSDVAEYLGARLKWLNDIEALLESRNVLTGGDR